MAKGIFLSIIYIFSVIIFIPFTVSIFSENKLEKNKNIEEKKIIDDIEKDIVNDIEYIGKTKKDEKILDNNFEKYIVGVVGAEMPISFHTEALKAQAVAARTYAYKKIDNINLEVDYKKIGQAYISVDEMKKKWGKNFDKYYEKISESVYDTKGEIMTYENQPIEAVFHSTSAGMTEVPENIWGKSLPYIQSVESRVDENAPNFIYNTTVSNDEIIKKILEKYKNIKKNDIIDSFKVGERSKAGYVLFVEVGGEKIRGFDIRLMYNLRSTNFTVKKNKNSITFTTKGYGHGAGMSQYGANFMAQDGKTYDEILNHYYKNISIIKIDN